MRILVGIGVVILLLVVLILSLPFLIDLSKYQDQYRPVIEEALNRKIALQDIRLTVWPRIGARVAGFTVMDDPAFSAGPFASLASLDVGVKLMPLLSGKVEVEEITLRNPLITVIKNRDGVVNLSTIGPKGPAKPQPDLPAPTQPSRGPLQALALLAVDHVSITGGRLTYRDQSTAKPTEYTIEGLEVFLDSVRLGKTPTLRMAATMQPMNLPVTLDGSFGPLVETLDLKTFAFALGLGKIELDLKGSAVGGHLDVILTAPVINTADVPMAPPLAKSVLVKDLHVTAYAQYPVKQGVPPLELIEVKDLGLALILGNSVIDVKGTVLGGHAKISATSTVINTEDLPVTLPFKKPVAVKNLQLSADLQGHEARLSSLSFQLFDGQAKAFGGMTLGTETPPFNGKLMVQSLQLGPALEALGTDKVSMSGTASTDLTFQGRGFTMPDLTRALEGTGHAAVKEGKLEGVNLMQEALALLNIVGVSSDNVKATVFSTIESDVAIKQGIVNVQRLLADSHDFQVTGFGTVGFDQTLNLKVNLNLSETLTKQITSKSPAARLMVTKGRISVPLVIAGTVQAPSYGLDTKAVGAKVQEQVQEKVEEAARDLLKGTSKPEDLKQKGQDLLKELFRR